MGGNGAKEASLLDQIFEEMFSIIKEKPEFDGDIIKDLNELTKRGKFKKPTEVAYVLRKELEETK